MTPRQCGVTAPTLPVTVGGHKAYGIATFPRTGYRLPVTGYRLAKGTGVATGAQPESIYEVASGSNATNGCCSDFGNVENASKDTGAGHMDALIISSACTASPCSGPGPWIQADMENGVFMGNGTGNLSNTSLHTPFVAAVLRNDGQANFALDGGDATQPTVPALYNGALPPGYAPMAKEGGIALGTGGDNSNAAAGSKVQLWNCNGIGGQQWVQQADGTLLNPQSGLCLTDPAANTANGTQLDIEPCAGAADQVFTYQSTSALTPNTEVSFYVMPAARNI
ncbi:ricin-type beta-trefoil lectin domain protein [Catenulispora sp. NF23]|uniref:arabinofuranosidase catalytic domain-containing protein n=1 Tax=Catenulispora pinistramenti TaxID=2705254 RepID=UPI001BAA9F57|nr:arabinofuranosidase catalytic domain-containing protein [Catenulispora pinistramenti]MBS2537194.1 ricin-type beta-trefoil lectin domain protein [Catenulispora pinistramenti]